MRNWKNLCSWFKIAKGFWIALILGWSWVFISWSNSFQPASSGAMLVGFAIIAEHFFLRWPHRKVDMNADDGLVVDNEVDAYQSEDMRKLSNEKDEVKGKKVGWKTAKRVERTLGYVLLFSVFGGTVIWGYGHMLVSAVCC